MYFAILEDKLYEILEKEHIVYRDLVQILKEEKNAIMDDDIERLNALIIEGKEKVSKIEFLENERVKLLSSHLGIKTINEIIEVIPPEKKEKFIQIKDNLLTEIEKVKNLKAINELLINKTLRYIHFYLELLSKETGPSTYKETGLLSYNENSLNKLDERV